MHRIILYFLLSAIVQGMFSYETQLLCWNDQVLFGRSIDPCVSR